MFEAPRGGPFRRPAWGLFFTTPALYVAVVAAVTHETRAAAWLGIALGIAVGAWPSSCRPTFARVGRLGPELHRSPARLQRDWVWAQASLSVALGVAAASAPWAQVARQLAGLGAAIAAVRAIAAIEPDSGLAADAVRTIHGRSLRLAAAGAVSLLGAGAATTLAMIGAASWPAWRWLESPARQAAAALPAGCLLVVTGFALAVWRLRRLELGPPPRSLASAGLAGLAIVAGFAFEAREVAWSVHAGLAALAIVRVTATPDTFRIARRTRRLVALVVFGAPLVGLLLLADRAPVVLAIVGAALVLVGAAGRALEEPFLPVRGSLLEALRDARRRLYEGDPRDAIAAALTRLREAAHAPVGEARSPEIWALVHDSRGPEARWSCRVSSVDAAGYFHEREAEAPALLLELMRDEPDATVRTEVLRALEVRRAELRPILRWLELRGALFTTRIGPPDEVDGLLLVTANGRLERVDAVEVRAARELADALIAACRERGARDRHLGRERHLAAQVEHLQERLAAAEHCATVEANRHALATQRLARAAQVGTYSARARMAYEALERWVNEDRPVAIVAPSGADPIAYLARAHLSSPRRHQPFVVVDGTSSREHDLARWTSPRSSPLALAHLGRLVLLDGAALPHDVQRLIAEVLASRRPPWDEGLALDVALAFTATSAPDALHAREVLTGELHARVAGTPPLALARLAERAEDLHAIVADRLAREGLRTRGAPLGIEARAFARLVEHPFEAEDVELEEIVIRLVQRARGDVVTAEDMDAIGLGAPDDDERESAPITGSRLGSTSSRTGTRTRSHRN